MDGIPHPSKGASSVVYFNYIYGLVNAGFQVLVLSQSIANEECEATILECKHAIDNEKNFHLISMNVQAGFTVSRFHVKCSTPDTDVIRAHLKEFLPDVAIAFDLAPAETVKALDGIPKIVWLGDMLFLSTWYNYIYAIREDWTTIRWLPYLVSQYFQWRSHYSRILNAYDKIIVSSKSSESALEKLGLKSTFHPYPWPNEGSLDNEVNRLSVDKPTFLFFGNLVGLGSRSSLHFLFEKLYPKLLKLWGNNGFEIIIGGSLNLRDWAEKYIGSHTEVKFEGFIDNLLEKMAFCHAVLVPVEVPVGNRSRILTAMSKRSLVIAHKNAALGNPYLIDNETALLAKDANEFAEKMRMAYEQKGLCKKIIDQAEEAYNHNYRPEVAVQYLIDEIETVVSKVQQCL